MNQLFEADTQLGSSSSPINADRTLDKVLHTLSQKGQQLVTLDLSDHKLTAADLEVIAPLLSQQCCPKLIKLNLSNNPLGDSMPIIANILLNNRTIADLNISDIGLTQFGCQQFQEAMQGDIIRLGRIVLSNNAISDNGLEAIIKVINFRCDPTLEFPTIECHQCDLSDDGFYALDSITERYDHVRVIFTGNKFSDQGLPQLQHALWNERHIKYLDLRSNNYSATTMLKILASALRCKLNFMSIGSIKLSLPANRDRGLLMNLNESPNYFIRITNWAIRSDLIDILAEDTQELKQGGNRKSNKIDKINSSWQFKRISFEKCQFSLGAIQSLSILLQKKSVHTLSFIECSFPPDNRWVAVLFSHKFSCTRQLILDVCNIDDDLLKIISTELKNIPELHSISLRSNLLTPRSIKRLEKWLGREKICDELILSGNNFENQGFSLNLQSPRISNGSHPVTPDPTASPPSEMENATDEIVLRSPRYYLERSKSSSSFKKLLTPRFRDRSASTADEDKPDKSSPKRHA